MHIKHKEEYSSLVKRYKELKLELKTINHRMFELDTSCRKCGCIIGEECYDWNYNEKYEFTICPECGDIWRAEE